MLLKRLLIEMPPGELSIGIIVLRMRRRSFGGIFLILATLGLLPGIATLAGLAMLAPAVQMALGYRAPVLPRFVRRRRINASAIQALADRAIPWIERVERYVKPRWVPLTLPPVPMLIGILTVGLALVIMLPLPFSNFPPAIALVCFSLGLFERDGLLIGLGLALSLAALAIGLTMAVIAFEATSIVLERNSEWLQWLKP